MKKIILLSLLCAGLVSCSQDENEAQATPETAGVSVEKLSKTEILSKYSQNKGTIGLTEARAQFAGDCKTYLTDKGISTNGLNETQIINLFMQNF